ncbi:MAG: MFS transporter [Comamonadaceae bacterium]|nr:MAG: MFS transporter [Comamonadaceae bacterium]
MAPSIGAATRWASRIQFGASGFIFATWGVHIPTVKAHYGLDEAQLGMAMLAAGFGAMVGLIRASHWIGRYGTRDTARIVGVVYALLLTGLIASHSYLALLAVLVLFGLATSVFDVVINTEAAQLELLGGGTLMSGMHGMFSLGGMVGAMTGGAALAAGLTPQWHLICVALLMACAVLVASRRMLPRAATAAAARSGTGFGRPRGALVVLGILAALGLIAEGAIYDWSVLYLHQELGSPQQQAALAYASFSAAMAAARFGGDALRARFAPAPLLRASALLAAAAMAVVLTTDTPWLALVGFAAVGIGFANVVPILFSAAARVPDVDPARGIAAVSAAAYLGFMVGPPMIGLLARLGSLTSALWLVVGFAAALGLSARHAQAR